MQGCVVGRVTIVIVPQAIEDADVVEVSSLAVAVECLGRLCGIVSTEVQSFQRKAVVGIVIDRALYADDRILAVAEPIERRRAADALFPWLQHGEHKIVIAAAAPSPVDVEVVGLVLILVAVADEGVATAAALTAQGNRTIFCQFAVDEVHPFFVAVVLAITVADAAVVAKDGLQRVRYCLAVCR